MDPGPKHGKYHGSLHRTEQSSRDQDPSHSSSPTNCLSWLKMIGSGIGVTGVDLILPPLSAPRLTVSYRLFEMGFPHHSTRFRPLPRDIQISSRTMRTMWAQAHTPTPGPRLPRAVSRSQAHGLRWPGSQFLPSVPSSSHLNPAPLRAAGAPALILQISPTHEALPPLHCRILTQRHQNPLPLMRRVPKLQSEVSATRYLGRATLLSVEFCCEHAFDSAQPLDGVVE